MSSQAARRSRPLIWLVDDSPTERALTERSLGPDYEFKHFADGSDVVELLGHGAEQPDVMLLDWVMPGVSGDEVCRFVRAHHETRELPVILVTASRVETQDVVRGLSAGANDYVARPFVAEELKARVEAVLRNQELQKASARERQRLKTINELSKNLFGAKTTVEILEELAQTLTTVTAEGCSILVLPGDWDEQAVVRHRNAYSAELAMISTVADPAVYSFESSEEAKRQLPPAYHDYIAKCGLRGLAILALPPRAPIHGLVTVTRDGSSMPFDVDDITLIETCIEYATLALQHVMRLDAERTALAQLHAVLAHAPIGIVVTDRAGTPTLVNPRAHRLVPGIERAESLAEVMSLVGVSDVDTLPTGPAPRTLQAVLPPANGGSPRTYAMTTVALFRDDVVEGSITTIDDITAEREIAAERERVANFQEQMLGIVGHDLRSPLSAILLGAATIIDGVADPKQIAVRIERSGKRMATIVNQLLDVTRARLGGGIPIERREVELGAVIRSVLEEIAIVHPAAVVQLVASDGVSGHWDADRLAQVISNLVGNAVQYGQKGHPIQIELATASPGASIVVKNALRGEPIPADRLAAMFEPFKRGSEGPAPQNLEGLGLGLYIVSEIVRAHQGTIVAESDEVSITFRIELPFRASSSNLR